MKPAAKDEDQMNNLEKIIKKIGSDLPAVGLHVRDKDLGSRILEKIKSQKQEIVGKKIKRALMIRRIQTTVFTIFFLILLVGSGYWYVEAYSPRASLISGNAVLWRGGNEYKLTLSGIVEKTLRSGDKILVGEKGQVLIKTKNIGLFTIGGGSVFSLSEAATLNPFKPKKFVLYLERGRLMASVEKIEKDELLAVDTSEVRIDVKGTTFNVTTGHEDRKDVVIEVLEGKVNVTLSKGGKTAKIIEYYTSENEESPSRNSRSKTTREKIISRNLEFLRRGINVSGGQTLIVHALDNRNLNKAIGKLKAENKKNQTSGKMEGEDKNLLLLSYTPYSFKAETAVQKTRESISQGIQWTIISPNKIWFMPVELDSSTYLTIDEEGHAVFYNEGGRIIARKKYASGSFGGASVSPNVIAIPASGVGIQLVDKKSLDIIETIPFGTMVGSKVVYSRQSKRFLAASTSGEVISFNENGKIIWTHQLGNGIYSVPCLVGEVFIVASENGEVSALNIITGKILWRNDTGLRFRFVEVVQKENTLYLGSGDRQLILLDKRTGAALYRRSTPSAIKFGPIMLRNGILIPYRNGVLEFVSFDGKRSLWKTKFRNALSGYVELKKSIILSMGDEIVLLDQDSGKVLRRMRAPDDITGLKEMAAGKIAVVTETGLILWINIGPDYAI